MGNGGGNSSPNRRKFFSVRVSLFAPRVISPANNTASVAAINSRGKDGSFPA